jgi:signal peptidase II
MMALPLKSKSLHLPIFALNFLAILCADQVSKQIMLDLLFDPPRHIAVSLYLNLVPVWNSGMSFGLLADGGLWVRIGLTALAFLVCGWFVWALPKLDRRQRFAGAIIAGGAIGNAIDRLRFGRVVDFIDFHIGAWHWPAFNVADTAITIGAGLWAYSILFGQETDAT